MKKTLKHLFSFSANAIASACLVVWIFGVVNCLAADFNDQNLEYNDDPIKVFDSYPPVAKGHEEIYDRFLNGKLIYKPNPNSDEGKIELRISDLTDPLDATFDLSRCGNADAWLSISTGFKKRYIPENEHKLEIWFAPRFLIEKELATARHFQRIIATWKETAEVGIFWTWGGWEADDPDMDYLTTKNMDNLSKDNLYESWGTARRGSAERRVGTRGGGWGAWRQISCWFFELKS